MLYALGLLCPSSCARALLLPGIRVIRLQHVTAQLPASPRTMRSGRNMKNTRRQARAKPRQDAGFSVFGSALSSSLFDKSGTSQGLHIRRNADRVLVTGPIK